MLNRNFFAKYPKNVPKLYLYQNNTNQKIVKNIERISTVIQQAMQIRNCQSLTIITFRLRQEFVSKV